MKKEMTIFLMTSSVIFAQLDLKIIGGITYSSASGNNVAEKFSEPFEINLDKESIMGFRLGVEKTLANKLVIGATYSQRGVSSSGKETIPTEGDFAPGIDSVDIDYNIDFSLKFAYFTGYVLKPFPIKEGVDLLAGVELGYFRNLEVKANMQGEYCIAGPGGGPALNCQQITENFKENIDADDWQDDAEGNMIDYGLVFGGRYAINEQISLVGTYYFGLAEATDDISDKHRGFQINISYAFQ